MGAVGSHGGSVAEQLRTAQEEKKELVRLNSKHLTKVPKELVSMDWVTELNLSNNFINLTKDRVLCRLVHLTQLTLGVYVSPHS